jgi:hypothetical protein
MKRTSDLSAVRRMLIRAKIEYSESEEIHHDRSSGALERKLVICLDVERGYSGFHAVFYFLKETGELLDLGAYE